MKLKDRIAYEHEQIARTRKNIDFLLQHSAFIEAHALDVDILGSLIDFDHPPREKVTEILKYFPGKWEKDYNSDSIDYQLQVNDSIRLRIWNAPPPPLCKIVEEEVDVPAQVVPAHKEIRRKIVCNDKETDEVPA